MKKQPLKSGEKILLTVFGAFFVLAMIGYIVLEAVRLTSEKPMFVQTTFFNLSEDGKLGHTLYKKYNCNACHRAMRMGTSMGLILDGIGSKYDAVRLEAFLTNPEAVYGAVTIDHGPQKEAQFVERLPAEERHLLAVFLSELKAIAGSSVAKVPPPERSEFVDNMVKSWAPADWKERFEDIREKDQKNSDEAAP